MSRLGYHAIAAFLGLGVFIGCVDDRGRAHPLAHRTANRCPAFCPASRLTYAAERPFAVAPKAGAVWPGHERRCRNPRDVDVVHHETPISYRLSAPDGSSWRPPFGVW